MAKTLKNRNPVAGNAFRYNRASTFTPKKGKGARKTRVKLKVRDYA